MIVAAVCSLLESGLKFLHKTTSPRNEFSKHQMPSKASKPAPLWWGQKLLCAAWSMAPRLCTWLMSWREPLCTGLGQLPAADNADPEVLTLKLCAACWSTAYAICMWLMSWREPPYCIRLGLTPSCRQCNS